MPRLYEFLKTQALRRLPESLLTVLKSRHYLKLLKHFNVDDEPDMKVVPLLVPAGSTAVDLGANVGVYTKLLSECVGPTGRVLSVEPIPQTFAILRKNVRRLGLSNVTLMNVAVSGTDGTALMTVPEYDSGGHNYYESRIESAGARQPVARSRRVEVKTRTLDSLVESERPTFIKCDVEGHEGAVISGGARLLADAQPAWLIEISENPDVPGTSAASIFARLSACGYHAWFFDGTTLRARGLGDRSTNYFFLTRDHVAVIAEREPTLLNGPDGAGVR